VVGSIAVFLPTKQVRAYLLGMASAGPKTIAWTLAAVLSVLSLAGTSHAAYGKVDAFVVRQTIRKDLPKINRCYESALRYEPELAGKVKVRFAVVRKGYVKGVRVVENTTGHPGVERCVARVVGAIRFPTRRYGKALSFTFPFVFAPQH
jgi:outer membrane biosynthesis protein TonB